MIVGDDGKRAMTTTATSLGDESLDRLCAELSRGLGAFGYQWLCACAIYPRLRFALSGYLGAALAQALGRVAVAEHEMLALYRLPWFREGHMPVELRSRLISDLEPEARAAALRGIERALYAAAIDREGEHGREPLLAPEPPGRWRPMLRAWLGAAPVDAVERETLFARALAGQTTDAAAVARDRARARLLGWRLARLLTWRSFFVLSLAALLVVGWASADSWLKPQFESRRMIEQPAKEPTASRSREPDLARPPRALDGMATRPPVPSDSAGRRAVASSGERVGSQSESDQLDPAVVVIRCPGEKVDSDNLCQSCPAGYRAEDLPPDAASGVCMLDLKPRSAAGLPVSPTTCQLGGTHKSGSCRCPAGSRQRSTGRQGYDTCEAMSDSVIVPSSALESCAGLPVEARKECRCPLGTEVGTEPSSDDTILTCDPTSAAEQANFVMSRAQEVLKAQGYYFGYADGIAGAATKTALFRFQKRNNLEPTGELDAATMRALGIGATPN